MNVVNDVCKLEYESFEWSMKILAFTTGLFLRWVEEMVRVKEISTSANIGLKKMTLVLLVLLGPQLHDCLSNLLQEISRNHTFMDCLTSIARILFCYPPPIPVLVSTGP